MGYAASVVEHLLSHWQHDPEITESTVEMKVSSENSNCLLLSLHFKSREENFGWGK